MVFCQWRCIGIFTKTLKKTLHNFAALGLQSALLHRYLMVEPWFIQHIQHRAGAACLAVSCPENHPWDAPLRRIRAALQRRSIRAAIGSVLAALCALAMIFWMGTARVPATTEQAQFWTYNRKENGADICILEVQGEGVWLDMEGTFSWGKPQITVRAMRYRFPGVHRVLTALVDSDRSTVWVMVSRTQLLTVDCADQTLYYRDGQLVDRYIVQENPDGTFDYAYGTDQEYGIDYKKG